MSSVYCIVAHKDRPHEAVEAWKECKVCSIGWSRFGDLTKSKESNIHTRLFLGIKNSDLILAYAGNNRIAYVGEVVDRKYIYDNKNIVGKKDGFDHPNQRLECWWKFCIADSLIHKQLSSNRRTFGSYESVFLIEISSGFICV